MEGLAIAVAWAGAGLVALSDGGRGQALGLALAGSGLGAALGARGGWQPGLILAAGGFLAAMPRAASGPRGWQVLRPGSTPRLMLTLIVGAAMLWAGASLLKGPGAETARMAVMVAGGVSGARLVTAASAGGALAAAGVLALALGAAGALEGVLPVLPALGAGCLAALATGLIARARPNAV